MNRHNLAQEQLKKATAEWEQHRKQTIDYVNLQLQKEHQASIDFQSVDNALDYYNELHVHPLDRVSVRNRPVLNVYYQPSEKMKNYEYLWIIVGMAAFGGAVLFLKLKVVAQQCPVRVFCFSLVSFGEGF